MAEWTDHLVVAPILVPLAASATMLLFDERRRWLKNAISAAATFALLDITLRLLQQAFYA